MKRIAQAMGALATVLAILAVASCNQAGGEYSAADIAAAAKELRALVPAIQAGLALAKPDSPTARALTPSSLKTSGVANPWTYGTYTPSQVYAAAGGTTGTVRLPASGFYELSSGDQLYFTLKPESAIGTTYYRMVLTTYPAFDLTVAYTIEEYIVNDAGTESWAWGNLNTSKQRDSWVSLETAYIDGTSGTRTVAWGSGTSGTYYAAFVVGEPVPTDSTSFVGYRYEESGTPPTARAGSETYSSHVTETVKGKGTTTDAIQYYTETTAAQHSGLTYVIMDKKRKWSVDTSIVTRMQEDTTAGSKKIRSVGEVGTTQYYIDKVDIAMVDGKITYSSTHDVYDTALPRGGDPNAKNYVTLALTEDAADAGTFTGTMEETEGSDKVVRDVTVERDRYYRLAVKLKYKSTSPRALADEVSIPVTRQDISTLSIPLSGVSGTFEGYYEAGTLFGTITTSSQIFDVVVAEEGVAVDDVLFEY